MRLLKNRLKNLLVWSMIGTVALVTLVRLGVETSSESGTTPMQTAGLVAWALIPLVFASAGGLIVIKQSRNVIGWLLIISAILLPLDTLTEFLLGNISNPPPDPSFLLFFVVWFSQVGWLLIIFPTLFITLLFPTGRPPSPRWRWVAVYGLILMLFFWILSAFSVEYVPNESYGLDWAIENPIGILTLASLDAIIFPWWLLGLGLFTLLCVYSLIIRYRRGGVIEREQIKWLLLAAGFFALFYVPLLFVNGESEGYLGDVSNILLALGLLGFPVAISIAILRYRLFDIDVIIRKTVAYAVLSGLLALVYFGTIMLLQRIFESVSGQQSPITIVISTLVIAALFNPLRQRVQEVIDRRFFRKKYDAQQALAKFVQIARDETNIEVLTAALGQAIEESLKPATFEIWLRDDGS